MVKATIIMNRSENVHSNQKKKKKKKDNNNNNSTELASVVESMAVAAAAAVVAGPTTEEEENQMIKPTTNNNNSDDSDSDDDDDEMADNNNDTKCSAVVTTTTTMMKQKKKKQKNKELSNTDVSSIETATDIGPSTIDTDPQNQQPHHHFYSNELFTSLPLCDSVLQSLHQLHYTRMTHIQYQAIPPILMGKDVIGAAPTGSGKTLAFVIPTIHILQSLHFSSKNGTGTIIITPTRELALQIYGVISDLCTTTTTTTTTTGNDRNSNSSNSAKHLISQTYGLLMGGANRRTEADKLSKGICIIVATPGRLLDHLQNTKQFNTRNLISLIIDEADRILEQGFEDDLRSILKLLPKSTLSSNNHNNNDNDSSSNSNQGRQTILFSATQTKKVQDLVRLSMNIEKAVFVDIPVHVTSNNMNNNSDQQQQQQQATAVGIEQGYVTCPSDQRFLLLFTFLKKNQKKKIMVFFSSCNSVKYHCELLNYIDIPCMDIHGRQKQMKRTTTFFQFCKNTSGILLCTDVAARGLDIPAVDWIIQFDPPDDPKEYIHRVGRTARGASGSGRALLFLSPQEIGFLKYLRAAHVSLSEYEFPVSKIANIQSQYYRLIESNYYLNRAAKDAYRSYLLSYASHAHRNIFNVHELDLQGVAVAFGFTTPPRVDINFGKEKKKSMGGGHGGSGDNNPTGNSIIGKRKKGGGNGGYDNSNNNNNKDDRKKQRIAASASGHAFSADNPYGKRAADDRRQFTH